VVIALLRDGTGSEFLTYDRPDPVVERYETNPRQRLDIVSVTCQDKNASGDEIANVNFHAVRPEGTRIR